jgi:hypothetical protein
MTDFVTIINLLTVITYTSTIVISVLFIKFLFME